MKWLVYTGPFSEVEVPHDDGTYGGSSIFAERGKAVEVSDEVADSLLAQGEEHADQIPVDPETGKPERAPQHDRTWRTATAKEIKAADPSAAETNAANEGVTE